MCEIIKLKDGKEITTVDEFEAHFGVKAEEIPSSGYHNVYRWGCLCQIDTDGFFRSNPLFYKECGTWYEREEAAASGKGVSLLAADEITRIRASWMEVATALKKKKRNEKPDEAAVREYSLGMVREFIRQLETVESYLERNGK